MRESKVVEMFNWVAEPIRKRPLSVKLVTFRNRIFSWFLQRLYTSGDRADAGARATRHLSNEVSYYLQFSYVFMVSYFI